ncbi:MAG: DNA pilot protein [Microvirus sp.]|nr:MAG: DNA pilot protein [Microvirus sp.]
MMDIMSLPISMAGQQMTNMQQADMMNQQMQFQERMSSTAYQRASADMKAAGLNPMMMANGGMNASAPQGSPASPMVKSGLDADSVQKAISTALAVRQNEAQVENIQANTKKQDAETLTELRRPDLIAGQTVTERQRPGLVDAEVAESRSRERLYAAKEPIVKNEAITAGNEAAINSAVRKTADQLAYGGKRTSQVLRPVSDFIGSAGGVHRMLMNSRRDARQAFD